MAKKKALTVTVRIDGVRETLAALNKLPKEANNAIRDRSGEIATDLAAKAKAAGVAEGNQARHVASTVRVRRDRVPVVIAGGTKKIGKPAAPAWKLLFVSEFGANRRSGWYAKARFAESTTPQFKPHIGRDSYWFFKTAQDNEAEIASAWRKAADDIVRSFGSGGV